MDSDSPAIPTPEHASQSKSPIPKHEFEVRGGNVSSFVFLHDNIHIVSGSYDGTICKWDCEAGLMVGEPWKGKDRAAVYSLALSPDGKTIACGSDDGNVQHWNTDGEMIQGIWVGHRNHVRSLSWSPSGDYLASGSDDATILIRKSHTGQVQVGPIQTKHEAVLSLAFSPSGTRIASGGYKNSICIWDSKTAELVVGPIDLEDLRQTVTSVVWSLDATKLYSASSEFVRVFDTSSGKLLHRFENEYWLYSVALSPKDDLLACVGSDGVARLWDTESHQSLGQPFGPNNRERLYCVAFSPNGSYLAYGGHNRKITLWNVNEIAPELFSFLDVDATNPFARSDGENARYANFFRSSQPSFDPSGPPHRPRQSPAPRLWDILIPSRRRAPGHESIPLRQRAKRSFFSQHSGPRPVTIYAARPKKLWWTAPRPVLPEAQSADKENGNTGQSPSAAPQPSSGAQAHAAAQSQQQPHAQYATQSASTQREQSDFGRWRNFRLQVALALCCIPRS